MPSKRRRMIDVRSAILRGKFAAARLHRQFDMRRRIEEAGGRVDVFDTVLRCGLPLLFRPLEGLLGAYLDDPAPGVLVTTKRPLSVQRFTGAHELGHAVLGHQPSLDDSSILQRSPLSLLPDYQSEEREADAFAAEFMLPPWLLAVHFDRQEWTTEDISDPRAVYQLSLRLGASYEATCWSLMRPGIGVLDADKVRSLLAVTPKEIKKTLLGDYEPSTWRSDVWVLTPKDEGATIEGSWSDLFVLQFTEHTGSGYLWDFEELNESGFAVVRDERRRSSQQAIGAHVRRVITTRSTQRHSGRLSLSERRPWLKTEGPVRRFCIAYDLYGPEEQGWSHVERQRIVAA